MEQSAGRSDIPLREPLDAEFKANRKLAKQLYNQERLDRVKANKEAQHNLKDQHVESLLQRSAKKEKELQDERRDFEKKQKILRE